VCLPPPTRWDDRPLISPSSKLRARVSGSRTSSAPPRPLPLGHALALGLLQGPTELLPVSSSAHTILVPWLCGWPYGELDPELRKAFEVALHAGASVTLALGMKAELVHMGAWCGAHRALALSLAPPVLTGYAFERPIERRFGGPTTIAAGLVVGALAMARADARPATGSRSLADAGTNDWLALGLAQALALIPGISRSGAVLTAARGRGFGRADSAALARRTALPVLLGASALKAWRLVRDGAPPGSGRALCAGAVAASLSTLACDRVLRRAHQDRPLWPFSAYRCGLATLAVRRLLRHSAVHVRA
jgi:undecaprenyl-diphosphatase